MEYLYEAFKWIGIILLSKGFIEQAFDVYKTDNTNSIQKKSVRSLSIGFLFMIFLSIEEASFKIFMKQVVGFVCFSYIWYKKIQNDKTHQFVRILVLDKTLDNYFLIKNIIKEEESFIVHDAKDEIKACKILKKYGEKYYDYVFVNIDQRNKIFLEYLKSKSANYKIILFSEKSPENIKIEKNMFFIRKPFSVNEIQNIISSK